MLACRMGVGRFLLRGTHLYHCCKIILLCSFCICYVVWFSGGSNQRKGDWRKALGNSGGVGQVSFDGQISKAVGLKTMQVDRWMQCEGDWTVTVAGNDVLAGGWMADCNRKASLWR
ncbi:hypothetical protein HS088_TW15G00841 [Tripterygium wilfordii]|uniref:Uncharacterized protein n=1 Tax=Tripterygium wilfordii TaxID=458696 RepID=A0A7J7CMS9_TRIWF|nr:hypothetical protein HS088_TW15G00841 [Tripterygium wilfordii]